MNVNDNFNDTSDDRLQELLADQALFGLEDVELAELRNLTASLNDDRVDAIRHDYEDLAARIYVTGASAAGEKMPAPLRASIRSRASAFFPSATSEADSSPEETNVEDSTRSSTSQYSEDVQTLPASAAARDRRASEQSATEQQATEQQATERQATERQATERQATEQTAEQPREGVEQAAEGLARLRLEHTQFRERIAWLVAAASLLVAVAVGWPSAAPTNAEMRAELQRSATDLVQASWEATEDPAAKGADGELIWSPSAQEGYMTFRGLAANNPRSEQYQLWIVDPTRDEHPVDGGVFDVAAGGGETIVPIRAKLPVGKPVKFVVTIEQPGGVVVSRLERVPLLASAP